VNKKILMLTMTLLTVFIMVTPLIGTAQALQWRRPIFKSQSFSATFEIDESYAQNAKWKYIPSEDDPKIIVVSWEENFADYQITVDERTYHLGTDFEHTGYATRIAIGAPFFWVDPFSGAPFGGKVTLARVNYRFDFSAIPGGIDGTLEMLCLWYVEGLFDVYKTSVLSLRGTGDLRNVRILATVGVEVPGHYGTVKGWPDIPPA
jgi:hypothetical protein